MKKYPVLNDIIIITRSLGALPIDDEDDDDDDDDDDVDDGWMSSSCDIKSITTSSIALRCNNSLNPLQFAWNVSILEQVLVSHYWHT